jgi:hypothetical protein
MDESALSLKKERASQTDQRDFECQFSVLSIRLLDAT